jgi:hypothetical protein
VKLGSGLCHVFFVSGHCQSLVLPFLDIIGVDGAAWVPYVSTPLLVTSHAIHSPECVVSYVIVYRAKHLLRRYYQARHLPYRHLEIHLGELEESFEETRHVEALITI